MCEPATIAMLALTTVGTLSAAQAANKEADIAEQQQQARYDLEREALVNEQEEVRRDALTASAETAVQAAILRGRQRVSAGEAGGGGNSSVRLLQDVTRQAGLQFGNISENAQRGLRQNNLELRGARQSLEHNRQAINARRPSALSTGLKIASSGVSAYSTYKASGLATK